MPSRLSYDRLPPLGLLRSMFTRFQATVRQLQGVVPFRIVPAVVTTLVLVTLLLIPVPEGLTPKAWGLVAIFVTTIAAIDRSILVPEAGQPRAARP